MFRTKTIRIKNTPSVISFPALWRGINQLVALLLSDQWSYKNLSV